MTDYINMGCSYDTNVPPASEFNIYNGSERPTDPNITAAINKAADAFKKAGVSEVSIVHMNGNDVAILPKMGGHNLDEVKDVFNTIKNTLQQEGYEGHIRPFLRKACNTSLQISPGQAR